MSKQLILLKILIFVTIISIVFVELYSQENVKQFLDIKGEYLGQKKPGNSPEIFAPDIVSTGFDELNSVFSPDGNEFYFSIHFINQPKYILLGMLQESSKWTKPFVLPFSGKYSDVDPAVSHDGKKILFNSTRPISDTEESEKDWDIWMIERTDIGWSKPKNLGTNINSDHLEVYPSITRDGTLYFTSDRPGGKGNRDIYRSRLVDGNYAEPEILSDSINTVYRDGDQFVAPDESYIIFESTDRPEGFGSGDLYISFLKNDGSWTKAKNMGEKINSPFLEYCPTVSPDGKYLFFTSYRRNKIGFDKPLVYSDIERLYYGPRNGLGDIYWVDGKIIDDFKINELK